MRNSIFTDFLSHLQSREDLVQSFQTESIDSWNDKDWYPHPYKGFYAKLRDLLQDGDWRHVSNRAGGFWGFWWGFHSIGGEDRIYLQIEEKKLVVKIKVHEPSDRKRKRSEWSDLILDNLKGFQRPHRFGNGKTMTIAEYQSDYRDADKAGNLDLAGTINTLRDCTDAFDRLVLLEIPT